MNDSGTPSRRPTHSQRQIWAGQRLNPDSPLYNMAFAWTLEGALDTERFLAAWRRVVDTNDVLRACLDPVDGEPRLRIRAPGSIETTTLDLRSAGDADDVFGAWCRRRCAERMDTHRSLVDSVLVALPDAPRQGGARTGWYLALHHLIADAWSTMLLYRQVAAEYEALSGDGERPEPLEDYFECAESVAEREAHRGEVRRAEAAEHWASRSAGRPTPFYGRSGRPIGTASTRLTLELDDETSGALDHLATEPGLASLSPDLSRFALFAALLAGWMHRISGDDELAFDAPVAGRPNVAAKRSLGLFIEMFPFRARVEPGDSLRAVGARCLAEASMFLRHALPGMSAPSGASANGVVLNFVPGAFGDFAGIASEVEWIHPGHGDSVHALRLQVHDFNDSGRYTLHFDFNDRALPPTLRERAVRHFEALARALAAEPDRAIDEIDLLTDEERRALTALERSGAAPPQRSVIGLFDQQADATPDAIALRYAGSEATFADLRRGSEALAAALAETGIEPGETVAILGRRSIETVTAILGTLRARAVWVPIDPAHPHGRTGAILADSGARLVLVGKGVEAPPLPAGTEARMIADLIEEGRGRRSGRAAPGLDDPAYLIYTSGSTGRPKGVLVDHDGLADYVEWASRTYVRGDRLTFALFTSFAFDLTLTSLFLPLVTGGTMEIYSETDGSVDAALLRVVEDNAVDFLKLTPSHLALLRRLGLRDSRLRCLVVGGEDFKSELAAEISAQAGDRLEIYNEYGPTEAVVACTVHRYRRQAPSRDGDSLGENAGSLGAGSVPIGRPADRVSVRILDDRQRPVPVGVPGELWVSRNGLSRGYHGLGALTEERFRPDPLSEGPEEGRRLFYRTGDRVRLLESSADTGSAVLVYLGRIDRQLKISGFRFEPGEIESALTAQPEIEAAAVILDTKRPTRPEEVRFCVACGLPSNYPMATLDEEGRCGLCRSYEQSRASISDYFRTMDELRSLFAAARPSNRSDWDCMMLLSGGKDSTYALCRLVEMGCRVYCFTLDNGFISEGAKENMRRTTESLGVPLEVATTAAMPAIFRDSLERFSNVCNGCFKTIYTLSLRRARELSIPIIVTGLSRGQMFETRLTPGMFREASHDGRGRTAEEIDAAILEARKVYHRVDDEVARSVAGDLFDDERIFDEVRFVDFYRYCDVGLDEVLGYLERNAPWVRPPDTGRSTNCLINEVGIWVHRKERGFHNYALPYSWDVRLGHKTRDQAMRELDDEIDLDNVRGILAEIGYEEGEGTAPDEAVLTAFYVARDPIPDEELRARLGRTLPRAVMPARFQRLDALPLAPSGKVDEAALLRTLRTPDAERAVSPPVGPVEQYLAEIWSERLGSAGARGGEIGRESDFFSLGGTSLGAMEIMIRLSRDFDLDLPLDTLIQHPVLSELAAVAEERLLAAVEAMDPREIERLEAERGAGRSTR